MEENNIIETTEEIIETEAPVVLATVTKHKYNALGVGLLIGGGIIAYHKLVKPAIAKHKAKKQAKKQAAADDDFIQEAFDEE